MSNFLCPECEQLLVSRIYHGGIQVTCPACGKRISVPVFEHAAPVPRERLKGEALSVRPGIVGIFQVMFVDSPAISFGTSLALWFLSIPVCVAASPVEATQIKLWFAVGVSLVSLDLSIVGSSALLRGPMHRARMRALAQSNGLSYSFGNQAIHEYLGWSRYWSDALALRRNVESFAGTIGSYRFAAILGWWDDRVPGRGLVVLEHEFDLPSSMIYPNELERLPFLPEIDMDSVEFSDAFRILSKDRKFAFDVCHHQFMEYLLLHKNENLIIEFGSNRFVLGIGRHFDTATLRAHVGQAIEVLEMVPMFVRE